MTVEISKKNHRIIVVGTSCSGKTTVAKKIAEILSIPFIELDAIHWKPDWQETPPDEFKNLVSKAIEPESWVVDGNYSEIRDIVWNNADTLVWLNLSFFVIFSRALKRTLKRLIFKEELFSGNKETIKTLFHKDCIPLWVIKTYRKRRKLYPLLFKEENFSHLEIVELKDQKSTDEYLSALKKQAIQT
ncbi:AAA family ATPase [bacterium]|nr:AAA family ATPase [bacterium]